MKLQNIPFTEIQTKAIYEFLSYIDKCNKDILSNCKIIAQDSPSNLVNNINAKNAYFGESFNIN